MVGSNQEERFARLRHRDTEANLDPTQFRMFSSDQGRWLGPDPRLGSVGNPQTLDRYAYVTGNPTNRVDPKGLCGYYGDYGGYYGGYCDPYYDPYCIYYDYGFCWPSVSVSSSTSSVYRTYRLSSSEEPVWETLGLVLLCGYKACDQRPSGDIQSYCNTATQYAWFFSGCPKGFQGWRCAAQETLRP